MPLPPATAAPVSAETRLAYVLTHFWQAYEPHPSVHIGYAPARPQVEVAEGTEDFFSRAAPYPADPNYREWLGQQVPFFFDAQPERPLLEYQPNRVVIHADVVAAAFYLLSGWQEYFSAERDQHGRFPYAASVQRRYGFVTLPVVNYYFDVLRAAVEHVSGQPLQPRRWAAGVPFATVVTHDIDNLYSAWKEPAKAALKQRNLRGFGWQLWQHLTRPDAWDNLAQVQQAVAQYGAASTYFFLGDHRPSPTGTPNADYWIAAAKVQRHMRELHRQGAEIATHGSLGTASHVTRLRQEAAQLPVQPLGNRFHYLSWEPRVTPAVVAAAGFAYDSTLGFAEHFGFRHSYCRPFRLFDFARGRPFDFLEIPLNLMDATLHHPRYLRLAPAEILPAIEPMLREIERFGGVFTLLWHNENFDPANLANGPREFHRIMEYLRGRQSAFLAGKQIWEMVKW